MQEESAASLGQIKHAEEHFDDQMLCRGQAGKDEVIYFHNYYCVDNILQK